MTMLSSQSVMPALHLNKEQVADLFTDYTKEKNNPVILEEVRTARRVMRDKLVVLEHDKITSDQVQGSYKQ